MHWKSLFWAATASSVFSSFAQIQPVISGALFAFATSFDEVVVTLFLAGADQTTLPRQMFTGIRENISPTIAALATILIVFSTCLLLALEWLRGRNAARAVAV